MIVNMNDRVRAKLTQTGRMYPHLGGPFENGEIEILENKPDSASSLPADGMLNHET